MTRKPKSNHRRNEEIGNITFGEGDQMIHSGKYSSRIIIHKNHHEPPMTSITELLSKARIVLKDGKNMLVLKSNLVRKINLLGDMYCAKLDLENEMQQMILDTWIEEILRFLALKSIMNDTVEPYQILPGYLIEEGWKAFMFSASVYSKICRCLGQKVVFDYNPEVVDATFERNSEINLRFNFTLRCYSKYFEQQPSQLYWRLKYKTNEKEDDMMISVGKLCGLSTSSLSSPFSNHNRRERSKNSYTKPSTTE